MEAYFVCPAPPDPAFQNSVFSRRSPRLGQSWEQAGGKGSCRQRSTGEGAPPTVRIRVLEEAESQARDKQSWGENAHFHGKSKVEARGKNEMKTGFCAFCKEVWGKGSGAEQGLRSREERKRDSET